VINTVLDWFPGHRKSIKMYEKSSNLKNAYKELANNMIKQALKDTAVRAKFGELLLIRL
jgi:hypothetical protein